MKYLNVDTRLFFATPIHSSGYAPGDIAGKANYTFS